jgi:hypothetical protein
MFNRSESSQVHRKANQHVQHAAVVLLVLVISIPGIRQEKTISNDASMPPLPGRQPGQQFFLVFSWSVSRPFSPFLLSYSANMEIGISEAVLTGYLGIL